MNDYMFWCCWFEHVLCHVFDAYVTYAPKLLSIWYLKNVVQYIWLKKIFGIYGFLKNLDYRQPCDNQIVPYL